MGVIAIRLKDDIESKIRLLALAEKKTISAYIKDLVIAKVSDNNLKWQKEIKKMQDRILAVEKQVQSLTEKAEKAEREEPLDETPPEGLSEEQLAEWQREMDRKWFDREIAKS